MKESNLKSFECTADLVESIRQVIDAEDAQDAERQFREMYPRVTQVYVKEWQWFEHDTQLKLKFGPEWDWYIF